MRLWGSRLNFVEWFLKRRWGFAVGFKIEVDASKGLAGKGHDSFLIHRWDLAAEVNLEF